MRHLVLAHRHQVGLVDEDVRRLEHRVSEVPVGDDLIVDVQIPGLLLEARVALQAGLGHQHREEQVQLRVLLDARLPEDRRELGLEPGGEPVGHHVERVLPQPRDVLVAGRQHVPVGDHVERLVIALQAHPVLERADVVAEMHPTGRPHAGEDPVSLHGASCGTAGGSAQRSSAPATF